ncbi:MAG TPA: hypothetical protein VN843_24120 [Anaerolineales bacterium]|nr:hypothetical protein [Anaerolineales bacterium]
MNITFKGKVRQADFQLYLYPPNRKNRVAVVFGRHGMEDSIEMSCNIYGVGHRPADQEEVYIRTWNECEGAVEALIEAGVVEKVGWKEETGYCYAELCKFTDKAMMEIRAKFNWPTPKASCDIQKLIDVLKEINNLSEEELKPSEYIYPPDANVSDDDGNLIIDDSISRHALVGEAEGLACNYLIGDSGGCNWANIKVIKEAGFDVFPGEKDSFGWLTGCIRTNKGIVVYG